MPWLCLPLTQALAGRVGIVAATLVAVLSFAVIAAAALPRWGASALWLLAPGPMLGLWALRPLLARRH